MPRIIVKCRYYPSDNKNSDIGGFLKYIATRKGSENPDDSWKNLRATDSQVQLINEIISKVPHCTKSPEYNYYNHSKTRGDASEFISTAVENNPSLLQGDSYLRYMGTRPHVDKDGNTHGLFSDSDKSLDLEEEIRKLKNHNGNIFSIIVSMTREDAKRLGYDNAKRWRDFVRAKIDYIAEQYKIPKQNLVWYGAFHNESHHPHIHLLLYSESEVKTGYVNRTSINNLRRMFGTNIFADDLTTIYKDQTAVRDKLSQEMRDEFSNIIKDIRNNACADLNLKFYIELLAERLKKCSGKKQYGYLPKGVKELVDGIVDDIAANEKIDRLYELWYKAKCSVYNTYTDNVPERLPLSKENAFKAIRNALITEANSLNFNQQSKTTESKNDKKDSSIKGDKTFGAAVRFANSLANTFRDNLRKFVPDYDENEIDKRLRKEIEQVKNGENTFV